MSDPTGQPKVGRKLAAILAADVVGYSRLMGMREEGICDIEGTGRIKVSRSALFLATLTHKRGSVRSGTTMFASRAKAACVA